MTKPLRLVALDADDLAVFSANLQDATIGVADMTFLPQAKRFVLAGCRFDWVRAAAGVTERCATGFHFEHVLNVARLGFDPADGAQVLNLLAIDFEATEPPSGRVRLTFSGGAAVRLNVECLEAQMCDLGPRWTCDQQPLHALDEAV